MAMQVKWNKKALDELDRILAYSLEEFGEKAAKEIYENITKFELHLIEHPELGHPEPLLMDFPQHFRSFKVHKHFKLIYKLQNNNTIRMVDLWDMRRNPDRLAKRIKK